MASNYLLKLFKKSVNYHSKTLFVYGPYQDINRFIPIIIDGCLKILNLIILRHLKTIRIFIC